MAVHSPPGRFAHSIAPGKGIALIILSGLMFTIGDVVAKWLRADYPVGEVLALRGAFTGVIFLALVPLLGGFGTLRIRAWRNQILRAVLVIITTVCFIGGLRYLPLATAVGIAFAGPIFTVVFAGPLLGERVGWRRWTAVGVGFAGVLIIVRPGGVQFEVAALLPLCTALFGALRDILTRRMSVGDHSNATLSFSVWATVLVGFASAALGLLWPSQQWVMPTWPHVGLFAVAGLFMGAGQYCIIESLRLAEAGLVVPFKYLSFVWAIGLGFLIWGDVPDAAALAGVALVIGSGMFIFWRERALSRRSSGG